MERTAPFRNLWESASQRLMTWGKVITFSHTIFALPFALAMFAIVARDYEVSFAQFFGSVLHLYLLGQRRWRLTEL